MKKKVSENSFGTPSKIKNIIITRRVLLGAAFVVFGLSFAAIFWYQTSLAQRNEQITIKTNEKQAENVWQTAEKSEFANRVENMPDGFQGVRLDKERLATLLQNAPHESRTPLRDSEMILQLPMPDGTFSSFRVQEAPVLEETLQAEFPEIKSYRVFGIDRAATTGRFDFTPLGLHATVITPDESFVILPADAADDSLYAVYNDREQLHAQSDAAICQFKDEQHAVADKAEIIAPQIVRGDTLKTYKMAFSTTFEYSRDVGGGTFNGTVASINGWLNGLNAIFEREVSVRMIGVISNPATNANAIFTVDNDPYDDRDINANSNCAPNQNCPWNTYHVNILHNRLRNTLRDKIGEDSYNFGHLLTTNTVGGVAGLRAVCDTDTRGQQEFDNQSPLPTVGQRKAAGHSVMDAPVGNFASLKLFAHEVGHQFGAEHTQNGLCARENTSAYEPGSGNTIMSYNGVCGGDNITGGGDLRFHGYSFDQITNHVINGIGASCGVTKPTGNNPPTVSAGANYTIPKLTPFTLTATGSDAGDPNNLTYVWEQFQAGGESFYQNGGAASYTDLNDLLNTTRPIFRATRPTNGSSRTFPSLEYILANDSTALNNVTPDKDSNGLWTAEKLPRVERTLNFRVTARDNVGGVNNSSMTVSVKGDAGPFTVNDPTGTWTGGSAQTVTWNVANTGVGTIVNAAKVRISLSTDGGLSFPITLAPDADNDGSQSVSVPNNISTSTARIKVEAVGNIFFDISGVNFSITPAGTCPIVTDISPKVAKVGDDVVITGLNFTGATSVTFNGTPAVLPNPIDSDTQITVKVPTGATGGKIVVSKNGCAAAESPTDFVVCPGSQVLLQIDGGTGEPLAQGDTGIVYLVNRLKPATYPATLRSVQIKFPGYGGFPSSPDITILSGKTSNGSVNNTAFRTKKEKAYLGETRTYDVEPITITSGEFVVGYSIDRGTSYYFPVEMDSTRRQGESYNSKDGVNFTVQQYNGVNDGTYRIRANVHIGNCTTGSCASSVLVDDGSLEFTATTGSTDTYYYVNRLTPSSYPATLTGVRLNTPFPAGTAIKVLSAANPSGSTNINNTSFNTKDATSAAPLSFANYPVTPITIYSGDFIVGYSVQRQAGAASVYLDVTPPIQGRSYAGSGNGTTFNVDGTNFPIRAVLFSNTCINTCRYTIDTTAQNPFPAEGGEAVINITTMPEGCPWRIARRNEWLTVYVASGAGNGTVPFSVSQNNIINARTGSLVIGPPTGGSLRNNLLENDLLEDNLEGEEIVIEQEALAPTAASVSFGGRVLNPEGYGLGSAIVSFVDQTGQTRIARTNPFGYYRFDEIAVGNTIVLNVTSKRYTFTPQVVTVTDSIENLDFVSLE